MLIYYMQDPPNNEVGFYFIASNEYDDHLSLYHSDHEKCMLEFKRKVEPGIIQVHDMVFDTSGFTDKASEVKNYSRRTVRMIGMREDEFIMDRAKYDFRNNYIGGEIQEKIKEFILD